MLSVKYVETKRFQMEAASECIFVLIRDFSMTGKFALYSEGPVLEYF